MSLYPTPTTYEFMDEFRDSPFYKEAQDYSGMSTMDQRYNPFTGSYGGSSDFNRYKHAYDKFLTERSKPADFDGSQALPNFQPITMKPRPSNQNPFMGGSSYTPSPFRGGPSLIGSRFGRSPFMGGFGRSPFMGGYGSPFGGLGMFGMSPYGGYGGYGMFGGMMNPFMGMGGFGQMQPYRGNLPFERRMRFPQQPQQPADMGSLAGGTQPGVSPPSTQQSTQGGNYMGPNVNNFMQNPFMAGLGSMMGNMFSGGYGSNVSNTQANVAQ